jgi:hypothetical protein
LSQSTVPHAHFARVSGAQLADPEFPGTKPPGENFAIDRVTIPDQVFGRPCRFLQMCGHYLVEPVACTPASGRLSSLYEQLASASALIIFIGSSRPLLA